MRVAATSRAREGVSSNGDAFAVFRTSGGQPELVASSLWTESALIDLRPEEEYRLVVVDGLGHGAEAAAASREVLRTVDRSHLRHASLHEVLEACHIATIGGRGATLAIADLKAGELSFAGVGNVLVQVARNAALGIPQVRALISAAGVIGYQLPPWMPLETMAFQEGDLCVLCTDGISMRFSIEHLAPEALQSASACRDAIIERYALIEDDVTVLVAR